VTRRRSSGAAGEPIRIDAALEAVTEEFGAAAPDTLTEVDARLSEWLGPAFDNLVRTRSLVDGELVVEAADTRVATDLQYRRDELAAVLAAPPLGSAIRRVRVVVKRTL
jgi:hypothetical protein